MAQIKVYQQGQLASPVVGTTGVDPSGGIAVNAALSSVENQMQNQSALNQASINSSNEMYRSGLQTGQTINQANIEARQTDINNENNLVASQVEFGNRAQNLQGENLNRQIGNAVQNFSQDRATNEQNILVQQAFNRDNQIRLRNMQNQLDARNALAPAIGQMSQYGANLAEQIKRGQIDGNDALDRYNSGIEGVKQDIIDGLPKTLSPIAKNLVALQLANYQMGQGKSIAEFGAKQATELRAQQTTTETSQIADDSGVKDQVGPDGHTILPALSGQAYENSIAKSNARLGAQIAVSGTIAGPKIIKDTNAAIFKNWAEANIENSISDENLAAVKAYMKRDDNGVPFVIRAGNKGVTETDVAKIERDITAKEGAIRTVAARDDKHLEMLTANAVLKITGPAAQAFDQKGIQQQGLQRLEKMLSDQMQQPPSEPNNKAIAKIKGGIDDLVGNLKTIKSTEDAERRHQQTLANQAATASRQDLRAVQQLEGQAARERKSNDVQRYNDAINYRAEINGLMKELPTDQKIKGTKEDFDQVSKIQAKFEEYTKKGYFNRGGSLVGEWQSIQGRLEDATDRINKAAASHKPGWLDWMDATKANNIKTVANDSEKLKTHMLSGAVQEIHRLYNPDGDRIHGYRLDTKANGMMLDYEKNYRSKNPNVSDKDMLARLRTYKDRVITPMQLVNPTE